MANFPTSSFTITNNETGRSVRVLLGETRDVGYYKEGTKYEAYVSGKPQLGMGNNDGSMDYQWYYDTRYDTVDRAPANQIVSEAVKQKQNIGNYCVNIYPNYRSQAPQKAPDPEKEKRRQAAEQEAARLRRLPIPDEWKGSQKVWVALYMRTRTVHDKPSKEGSSYIEWVAQRGKKDDSFKAWLDWTGSKDALVQALQDFATAADEDKKTYTPPPVSDKPAGRKSVFDCEMKLYGTGTSRGGNNYRWQTDGTYIWACDDRDGLPASDTYWTDVDGKLVGRSKGGPGQTWTLKRA
ncbi:hypothetical protein [Nocardia tenerifensis]|nr:hypothetical protein [Nocardia tenerifensis]